MYFQYLQLHLIQEYLKFEMLFKKVCQYLIKCISALNQLALKKMSYIKKINYQIHKLIVMMTLKFSEEKNFQNSKFALVETINVDQIFSDSQINFLKRLFVNKQNLLNYEDLCQYLGVNTLIGNKYIQYQIQKQDLQAFIHIVREQKKVIQDFVFSIKETKFATIQQLFDQIDFFNNGYINVSSLIQFINHYGFQSQKNIKDQISNDKSSKQLKQQQIHENKKYKQSYQKGCQILLKYIKKSYKGEKIFLKDFQQFFDILEDHQSEQEVCNQINKNITYSKLYQKEQQKKYDVIATQFHNISQQRQIKKNNHILKKDKILQNLKIVGQNNKQNNKHIICDYQDKYSNSPIKSINNLQCQNQQQKNSINLNDNKNYPFYSQRLQFGQSQILVSFEDKMIQTFKRNQAYIKQIKGKQQFYPQTYKLNKFEAVQSRSKTFEMSKQKTQFILGIKILANEIFNKKNIIQRLINQFPKFTLLNAFNVIDDSQKSKVNYQEFKAFLNDCQIQKAQGKVIFFFASYSKLNEEGQRFMDFSCFSKVFKLKFLENQLIEFKKRKPLIYQSWTKKQKSQYCSFIRNIIDIQFNIHKAKKHLSALFKKIKQKKHKIEDLIFEKQIVKSYDFKNILGQNSQAFISEITKQDFFDIRYFEQFLNN